MDFNLPTTQYKVHVKSSLINMRIVSQATDWNLLLASGHPVSFYLHKLPKSIMEPMEPDSKCLMGLKETEGGGKKPPQNNQLLTEQFYTAMEEK